MYVYIYVHIKSYKYIYIYQIRCIDSSVEPVRPPDSPFISGSDVCLSGRTRGHRSELPAARAAVRLQRWGVCHHRSGDATWLRLASLGMWKNMGWGWYGMSGTPLGTSDEPHWSTK